MHVIDKTLSTTIILFSLLLGNYLVWLIYPPNRIVGALYVLVFLWFAIQQVLSIKDRWPIVLFVLFAIGIVFSSGSDAWDARSIWLFHAKKIFYDNNLYAQLDNYGHSHSDYPALIPALSATLGKIIGTWNEVYPKSASLFFIIPVLVFSVAVLAYSTGSIVFLVAIVYFSGTHLLDGYVDGILALYAGAYCLLLLSINKTKPEAKLDKPLFLALILILTIITLLKNEGFFIALFLMMVTFISVKPRLSIFYMGVFPLGVYFLSWKIPVILADLPSEFLDGQFTSRVLNRIFTFESWEVIARFFYENLWISILALSIFMIIKRRNLRSYRPPLYFCSFYLVFLAFVYFSTPLDLNFHLITSADRTLLTINIVLVSTIAYGLRDNYLYSSRYLNNILYRMHPFLRRVLLTLSMILSCYGVYYYLKSPIEVNHQIEFSKNKSGVVYLRNVADLPDRGWAHPEVWGVWLNGYEGKIAIPLPTFPSANFIELNLRPFIASSIQDQDVTISVGKEKQSYRITYPITKIKIPIDAKFPWKEDLVIKFQVREPKSPKELGIGNDDRPLSVGLISATFY